jgi:hypothetical protein
MMTRDCDCTRAAQAPCLLLAWQTTSGLARLVVVVVVAMVVAVVMEVVAAAAVAMGVVAAAAAALVRSHGLSTCVWGANRPCGAGGCFVQLGFVQVCLFPPGTAHTASDTVFPSG